MLTLLTGIKEGHLTNQAEIFVNVVDMVDACTRGIAKAAEIGDPLLESASRSVMSAIVFHLGKRHANLPGELRSNYDYLLRNV